MSDTRQNEIWQVDVGGQVYEAAFAELGEWIREGSLQPEDKVRKGNLRWIDAARVPLLVPFFNAKQRSEPMPLVESALDANETSQDGAVRSEIALETLVVPEPNIAAPINTIVVSHSDPNADPAICSVHSDRASMFLCDGCLAAYCKACPKSYGGSVKICLQCGQMCRPISEVKQRRRETDLHSSAALEGFGFVDFGRAVAYPLKFKTSLVFGAIMFAFFTVGQSVSAIGGIFMMVAAIFCLMLANMLTFGVFATTVDNFTQGKLDADFMPSFDDFSIWDDVLHPFFLYIGAVLVSFGPFLAVMLIGVYLLFSSFAAQRDAFESEIESLPGTQYYSGRETVAQSQDVRRVLTETADSHQDSIVQHQSAAQGNSDVVIDKDAAEQEALWAETQEARKAQLESAFGKTPETKQKEFNAMVSGLLGIAAPVVVIGGILFVWGLLFFPAACAVAGYTRSFLATINPLVGLDTIKRLGVDYAKILGMGLLIAIASAIIGVFFAMLLFPFDLPGFGNIPAKAISALFGFYFTVVFSCVIAYALFKNADKLALSR